MFRLAKKLIATLRRNTIRSIILRQVVFIALLTSVAAVLVLTIQNKTEWEKQQRASAWDRVENHVYLISTLMSEADFKAASTATYAAARDANISTVILESANGNVILTEGDNDHVSDEKADRVVVVRSQIDPEHIVGRVRIFMSFKPANAISLKSFVFVVLTFIIVTNLLCWRLNEGISEPLRLVLNRVSSTDGVSWPVVDMEGPFEVRQLNAALSGLVEKVSTRTQELDHTNTLLKQQLASNEESQHALLRAQKLESIGRLAGGIAHDFNNILMVIHANLEVAKLYSPPTEITRQIDISLQAIDRGASLTRNLLSFAQRSKLHPEVTSINNTISNIQKLTERAIPSTVSVVYLCERNLWSVLVDSSSMDSALLNLIVNAKDAVSGQGRILVQSRNVHLRNPIVDWQGDKIEAGRYVVVTVSDNGSGMDQQTQDRIFEPFFTTKREHKCTGLGLPTVIGFVKQSQGHIMVESSVGNGAEIRIFLPAIEKFTGISTVGKRSPDLQGSFTGNCLDVLLIDDEQEIRSGIAKLLLHQGCRITQAESGKKGIAMLSRNVPDLVICDVSMPGPIQGSDVASWIRNNSPELPVIFLSGELELRDSVPRRKTEFCRHLTKPVSFAVLRKSMDDLLSETCCESSA